MAAALRLAVRRSSLQRCLERDLGLDPRRRVRWRYPDRGLLTWAWGTGPPSS